MLAKRVAELPTEGAWIFEPKWDGFRALIFRDGDDVIIQSRDDKPLNRYFPDLLEPLRTQLPKRCVLDGEIVIVIGDGLDFDRLQLRLHPAASRVKLLASQTPASVVFFDVLCEGETDLREQPFESRRQKLESPACLNGIADPSDSSHPLTSRSQPIEVSPRFEGAGLDGVIAKPVDGIYEPDKRVMLKIKHQRECDCVVAGFRWHKKGARAAVGSLLLGLFNDAGALQHVGVCASFTQEKRLELTEFPGALPAAMRSLITHTGNSGLRQQSGDQRMPGGQSRWSQGKDLSLGARCVLSLWWRVTHMNTCPGAIASVICRSFEDGASIRSRPTAPTRSWKWWRLTS